MNKRMITMIIALVTLFGLIYGYKGITMYIGYQKFKQFTRSGPPPITISATKAKSQTWQPYLESIGTLQAANGVNISTETNGKIINIAFKSGQFVNKNDLLFHLDDSIDTADLQNANAELKLAEINYKRQVDLVKQKATPFSKRDEAKAKLQQAQAAVAKTQALIAQKYIRAPFAGKIGIRQVNLGDYVTPGKQLVILQALDPLYLNFSLPEKDLDVLESDQAIQLRVDVFPKEIFFGKMTAIDAHVNPQTHHISLQATVPNTERRLYPGLFADIKIMLPKEEKVVAVPETAITYSLYGDSVYLIERSGKDEKSQDILKVKQRYVTTGRHQGSEISILKGIKPGELVAISGQLKLRNDARVIIDNTVSLENKK